MFNLGLKVDIESVSFFKSQEERFTPKVLQQRTRVLHTLVPQRHTSGIERSRQLVAAPRGVCQKEPRWK